MGQVVCMRCGVVIMQDERIPGTSHGVCPKCQADMKKEIDRVYPPKK